LRFLFLFVLMACSKTEITSLEQLDNEISKRIERAKEKNFRILTATKKLSDTRNSEARLLILKSLCQEYKSYSFDSASKFSIQYLREAKIYGDRSTAVEATILHAYILLSAGIINQAIDSLKKVSLNGCSNELCSKYYFTLSKGYYELANFNSEKSFSQIFHALGNNYIDSAISFTGPKTIERQSFEGLKALKSYKLEEARRIYEGLVHRKDLPTRQLAIESACLANTYEILGDKNQSIKYFTLSAISDEVSSVKEYTSLIRLATYLFENGDFERSNRYINLSLDDANHFGSRQRKIQVLEIFPLIKAHQLSLIKEKRDSLIVFSSLLTLLLFGCVLLIVLTIRQNQKIKKNEERLEQYNLDLERKKSELEESQIIKEQYVGYFFQTNTRLINKVEKVVSEVETALKNKDLSEIKFKLSQLKPSQEKSKLLRDFDHAFLNIFPDFVKEINQLLQSDFQFTQEDQNMLNTELRIFALMRMGIQNNEIIAKSLGYSVNTIYTYKTKIRNKSLLPSEDFDNAIRKIRSVKS